MNDARRPSPAPGGAIEADEDPTFSVLVFDNGHSGEPDDPRPVSGFATLAAATDYAMAHAQLGGGAARRD